MMRPSKYLVLLAILICGVVSAQSTTPGISNQAKSFESTGLDHQYLGCAQPAGVPCSAGSKSFSMRFVWPDQDFDYPITTIHPRQGVTYSIIVPPPTVTRSNGEHRPDIDRSDAITIELGTSFHD